MNTKLQLYSLATPNGQKVSIALEEMGLAYDAHTIDIMKGDQFTPEFIAINPNSKIPALVDPVGDHGKPLAVFESGAILVYLAEKTGKFLPKDITARTKVMQWLFFQMGGIGPMFGQFGHFYKYAKDKCDHPYPVERSATESKRLLAVLETQLAKNQFIAGDEISIADFALYPWVRGLSTAYGADDKLELAKYTKVNNWRGSIEKRPLVEKALDVCSF